MKIFYIVLVCLVLPGQTLAMDIQALLDAAVRQPGYVVSTLSVQESELRKQRATAALFPEIGLFGQAEIYNSPTNLRPVTPTESSAYASGESVPFSEEILRYGLSFDAPVYVHELYVLRRKSNLLRQKAEVDRRLDMLGRQSAVVSLNSALAYLKGLEEAIASRHASLGKTLEDMSLKVKTGRSPESELLKIEKSRNDLDQQRNELSVKRLDTMREIQALTGVELSEPVAMTLAKKPSGAFYLPVAAAQINVEAAQKEVERQQATRYPTVSATGFVSGNDGEAYNTDSHIHRTYSQAALVIKMPLFDRTLTRDIDIARIQAQKAQRQLDQVRIDMEALAGALDRKLPVLEQSIDIAEQSIEKSQALLQVAQVAVRSGRMTLEDYLRYESDVLAAQATRYQVQQQRWLVLSQQAALFGTDLKEMVK